jgi:hypothetical protein
MVGAKILGGGINGGRYIHEGGLLTTPNVVILMDSS